ncbi:MAG: MBL fold metallo-hydrolase [Betaproteobacteria bacterium]|jgi:glyoxylase-like metal-dependent hydrolase (beta-lactamase superfamily II)|nr:MBL fold metallo-hydrolase [Betaproteobacteria bacterium]NBP45077.1 MBL fold metallo-hydrolase [Betaproteobacteria bacterium]
MIARLLRCLSPLLLIMGCGLTKAQMQADGLPPMTLQTVGRDVYFVQGLPGVASSANAGFNSNAGAVATGAGLVVFDSLGSPALADKFIRLVQTASGERVKLVVVSHYHADHFYGLQSLLGPGVEVVAHPKALSVFQSDNTAQRLAQRKQDLFPWVNEQTRLIAPTRVAKVDGQQAERLQVGRYHFTLLDGRSGHAEDDLMMRIDELGVLFTGDLFFTGRLPFVGNADPNDWLRAIDNMMLQTPKVAIPGHGPISYNPAQDIALTQRYLKFLGQAMAKAVSEMQTFEEAYASTDWSDFKDLPAFEAANKLNAYGAFVNAEKDVLKSGK